MEDKRYKYFFKENLFSFDNRKKNVINIKQFNYCKIQNNFKFRAKF